MKVKLLGKPWWPALMLMAVLAGWSNEARARDCYLLDTWRYSVNLEGTNQLRLKMPLYDKDDYDCWIVEGTVYIQPEGGSKETLFYYESQQDIDRDDYYPRVYCYKGVEGTMTLYRDRGYSAVSVGTSKGNDLVPCVDNQDYAVLNLLWTISNKFRGKKCTISWSIHHNGNLAFESDTWPSIDPVVITIPAAPERQYPMVMDPIISYDNGRPNQMMVPYMIAANNLQSMKAYYTEVYPSNTTQKTSTLETAASGYLWLPADVCVRDFYVEASYKDSENNTQTTTSPKIDLPILHHPRHMAAAMQPNGTVIVSWGVGYRNWAEISSSDTWEIQRNVSGDPTNNQWMSLGQQSYDEKLTEFSYEDKTLLAAYQGKDVYYRVRRTITAVWEWGMHSGYATTMLPATLALPTITEATVSRNGTWNDNDHSVQLKFKGRMLTADPVTAVPEYDKDNCLVLRDSTDWELFMNLVKEANGTKDVNAIMAADITTRYSIGSLDDIPYCGTFNGNGHTLTVNINGGSVSGMAPFSHVKEAAFKNLRVCGIVSGGIHSAGLIGFVESSSSATVDNCHISTQVTAQGNANNAPHAGGIIGHGGSGTVAIRKCLFDGTVIADNVTEKDINDSYIGAFLGWADSGGSKNISNNLERGSYINFVHCGANYKYTGSPSCFGGTSNYNSNNWGETDKAIGLAPDQLAAALGSQWKVEGGTVLPILSTDDDSAHKTLIWDDRAKVVLNTYKYVENTDDRNFVIRSTDDWTAFAAAVKKSKGDYEVNCVLKTDITVSECLSNYSGTIEGNGHTMTLNIIDVDYSSRALIRQGLRNITIRNLNVNGEVYGDYECAALVGYEVGSNLTIENCHVSTKVETQNGTAAGFVATVGGTTTIITIRDCLFDGELYNYSSNSSTAAAFINGDYPYKYTTMENCLENGSYQNFSKVATNYTFSRTDPQPFGGTNVWTYATTGFDEINHVGSMTPEQLAAQLGSKWQVKNGKVVPIQEMAVRYTERRELTNSERLNGQLTADLTTVCVDHEFYLSVEPGESTMPLSVDGEVKATKTEMGNLAAYKFDNNVVLGSAKADTLQNAVSLSWECTRGQADFYRIKRYDKLTPNQVETLEDNYSQTAYMDRTVRPQHNYKYIIEGVTQCEGENVSQVTVDGCCVATGMVRGYVRLTNGIGLPGYTVTATPMGEIDGAAVLTCETDSTGFFEIGGLVYQKYGEYTLTVTDPTHEATFRSQIVTFDEDVNLQTNIVFTQTNYYIFAGYVLYEGSSIPVSGVRFLRDGVEVVNSNGKPVTTNNQGAFEVSVPQGSHQIQVVKDGHVFMNDGFFITPDAKPDSTWHNWQKNVSEIYLWDQTKVQLQGRVVGGNDQGLLPLGQSLSKNNLGQDITIVMQLEGDNTSWIVRDQKNASVTERHDAYAHGKNDTTLVDAYRHRIEIHPDPKTGEYRLPMYPVKYKVTEVYAKGYPTLFQTGMVSETLDLNGYAEGDTATWRRIFHSQPVLDIWQFNGTQDRFYGLRQYTAMDNLGGRDTICLWKDGTYAMGHPVFMAGSTVPMLLSAREEYRYNNEELGELDVVQLDGGKVYVANGLVGTDTTEEVELDSLGQGTYIFTPQNTTFTLEGDLALRKMDLTLLYDGSYYDIQPIEGYVMAALSKKQGRRIIAGQNTHLVDILRDPPGAGSSAYIGRGSKFSYSYEADYSFTMGVNLSIGMGSGSNFFTGMWAGVGSGTAAGIINSTDNYGTLSYTLGTTYYDDWKYNYEFEAKEKISTSSSEREVGAASDVYIGMTDNVIVEDAIAVRVVSSKGLEHLKPGIGGTVSVDGHDYSVTGTAKVLASGWDGLHKDSVYLVRDEVMQFSSSISSTFAHSQSYIVDELIPNLVRVRNALLMDSTVTAAQAQALADAMKYPVYVSKVSARNPSFSLKDYYTQYTPAGTAVQWSDSILALNNQIRTWAGFIAANEKEKLEVRELVKVFDFDGAAGVEHSESFTTTEGLHRYWKLPAAVNLSGGGIGHSVQPTQGDYQTYGNNGKVAAVDYEAGGIKFTFTAKPLLGFDFNYKNGSGETYSKEAGFKLACSRKSNLSVAVYRVPELSSDSLQKLYDAGEMGVYYRKVEENLKSIYNGSEGSSNTTSYIANLNDVPRYRNFVYRTLGGATASPWEDERRTQFYNPGMVLDQQTLQINKLRIWAKESSVSNVPYGDPARFTIYMTNESELPARVTKELKYFLENTSNSKGAKVLFDGCPLTGAGIDLWLEPNTIIEKQVEVYAGAEYDYDDLAISLMDPKDVNHIETVTISAHYVPAAGGVNISKPGDKWVVNTESAYDDEQDAYYLPVHIDGFDINFRNFDHIELQYKLSTQGDKDWVNVCSYYPNTEEGQALMALASGKRQLMEHDGYIDAFFYGETDPIEQYYDIRAVTFCRHGNGYLTRSSNILTGIKDTRRPQLFGTPLPVDGILDIGDDIVLRFSEPIAGNYLSAVNNFEVIGQTNSSNISLSSSLHFDGMSVAETMAPRNLAEKSFTVDVMLNPADNGKAMPVMGHGEDKHKMALGLTADRRLTAILQYDEEAAPAVFTATEPCRFDGLHEVFYIFDADVENGTTTVTFYDGTAQVGSFQYPRLYEGHGNIFLGVANEDLTGIDGFVGEMLEFRLWNHALTEAEMAGYGQKSLTGYEPGLLDNYPLNEGVGEFSYNRTTGGSDLWMMLGTSWKMPDGIGMRLDGEKGFRLNSRPFERFSHEDYTLMFWYRTNDVDGTLLANGRGTTEAGSKQHFCFNVAEGRLGLNLSGLELHTPTYTSDGSWHHVALTVNRAGNVGCLYVDRQLTNTFAVDTLGGISGNLLAAGATYVDAATAERPIAGHIDEIAMFEMALPENVIRNFSAYTPQGELMGLMAYLNFSQNERQQQNDIRLVPSGVSLRRYKDITTGEWTAQRDTIVAQADIDRLCDRAVYAPMHDLQTQENIKFSYVADGKDLLINLDVPEASIEKTNVYVVVKDVADLQGNLMASPAVVDLYVYRNPLRWTDKHLHMTTDYGTPCYFTATVKNLSGKSKRFSIEGLPVWMTVSETSNSVGALDEETITFTISPYTNIGNYEETIYMVGDNGMSEPLPISLKVRGEEPDWAVGQDLLHTNISMSLIGQVIIDGNISRDSEDMLAVFNKEHRLLGVTHLASDPSGSTNDGLAYLNIYNSNYAETPLTFEFFDASTGKIHTVEPADGELVFKSDTIIGSTTNPVVLEADLGVVQAIHLKKGWNWVSFNVKPGMATVRQLLNNATKWQVGDALEAERRDGSFSLLSYKATMNPYDPNTPVYAWDCADSVVTIDARKMYRFYSTDDKVGYIAGFSCYDSITVGKGWNRIGFLSDINLPLGTALAEYTEQASAGDIIKSQSEFAILTVDALGNKQWKGTLEYMRVGEGYMLKRNQNSEARFEYPIYYSGSRYNGNVALSKAPAFENTSGSSMTVVAVADGVETVQGDRLTVYRGAEVCGIAEADEQGLFFLTVGADGAYGAGATDHLTFTIERDGELVAATQSRMSYVPDAALGTPDEPTAISFLPADYTGGDGWYSISGVRLSKRPTQQGIYIHRNEKVVIK